LSRGSAGQPKSFQVAGLAGPLHSNVPPIVLALVAGVLKLNIMQIEKIIGVIEDFAPLELQESYDNCGLLVGKRGMDVKSVLLCLDVTEEVVDEAESKGAGMIISHHPVIFRGIRKITDSDLTGRIIMKAISRNIAIYSAHTNIDKVWGGVNSVITGKLGLKNTAVLSPEGDVLRKLVVFVPAGHAENVREAMFAAGAGHIGEYDKCSFNLEGEGSFRGSSSSEPYSGKPGTLHFEKEVRVETIYPSWLEKKIIKNMIDTHPYEEVAYDIYSLGNRWNRAGAGMTGNFDKPLEPGAFLKLLKNVFKGKVIRHTKIYEKPIERVAVCGGSGSSLINAARACGADAYVSGDFKYHDFFEAGPGLLIADIGHYESEQFTVEIFHDLLTKNFPNFAIYFSDVNTNPIYYYK
jgi:dinuclear metal center YbgI/SA1388 family protein